MFVDEPKRVEESLKAYETEFRENMKSRLEGGYILPGQAELLYSVAEVQHNLEQRSALLCMALQQELPDWKVERSVFWLSPFPSVSSHMYIPESSVGRYMDFHFS